MTCYCLLLCCIVAKNIEMVPLFFLFVASVYLDHVGATLYSKTQLHKHFQDLSTNLYGNPHSRNPSSQLSLDFIEEARWRVAKHFNTTLDRHHVIFTSGATGGIKLIAETFKWNPKSCFCYLEDNHTSVVGIREIASVYGSKIVCASESNATKACKYKSLTELQCYEVSYPLDKDRAASTKQSCHYQLNEVNCRSTSHDGENTFHLFAYPAMSNFCGRKYPLTWTEEAKFALPRLLKSTCCQTGNWYVLLDTASFVSTSPLDLSQVQADFVTISFYKMFGFPTGLGALIIRKDAVRALPFKRYYGGGTVASTISRTSFHVKRDDIAERLV